jgi:hypothetical protein
MRLRKVFDSEMQALDSKVDPIRTEFIRKANESINTVLKSSIKTGAAKASKAAAPTIASWTSKNRRTRNFRSPEQNGLIFHTYNAVVKRSGLYTSKVAGEVDFNQELCEPCEKEFSADWQRIMGGVVRTYLAESEQEVTKVFQACAQAVVRAFVELGMDAARLRTMANSANHACTFALKTAFNRMRQDATKAQRGLNRMLTPKVRARMQAGYTASAMTDGGKGRFFKMKSALESFVQQAANKMFDEGKFNRIYRL